MGWFVNIITYSPLQLLMGISVWHIGFLYLTINIKPLPRFQDPQLGFETRGTEISERLTAWEKLMEESKPAGSLVINPSDIPPKENIERHKKKEKNAVWKELQKMEFPKRGMENYLNDKEISKLSYYNYHPDFFCDSPTPDYGHIIVSSINGSDLFTLPAIRDMCKIQNEVNSLAEYANSCFTTSFYGCCNMWSLPNYIAWLHKLVSCTHIEQEHVSYTINLLKKCSVFYHNHKLMNDGSSDVPKDCSKNNAVYNMIHYILDFSFLPSDGPIGRLQSTSIFLPVAKSSAQLALYHQIENSSLYTDLVEVTAMDLGLKYLLFDEYLIRDTRLLLFTSVFIVVCIWWYTGCAFITLLTVIAIFFSLVLSYIIYTDVLLMKFFPFMNILAVIVALGIGSDDAYIMCKVWDRTKKENPHLDKVKLVQLVIKHSTVAVFVTTLTTVAAFLSSFVSSVTAVRCFSVFAGLSVLANFVFMITWLLAGIVLSSDWPYVPILHWGFNRNTDIIYENILIIRSSFNDHITNIIRRYHKTLIGTFGFISLVSMHSVIFWPKLQVPDSAEFQLFHKNHPFEQYDLVYKHQFWFNRIFTGENAEEKLPLRFVWGVLPVDNGNYLDPSSRGSLYFDPTFDVATNTSQEWLLKFCRKLRMQPFYRHTHDPMISNCFIETFKQWMERKCFDPIDNINNKPCCEESSFPYSRHVFNHCILQAMEALYKTPQHFFISEVAGPRFSKNSADKTKIKAMVVEFDSSMSYTTSFEAMNTFHKQVDAWTKEEFAKAPEGMKNGWYVTHLAFYDLQRTLTQDTGVSIIISMSIALLVLFMVTLNVPLSLYAILTISCIIFVSVSILIALGWKLNVLESIAISVTIGLSVDFSLHYAVNYKLAPEKTNRQSIVVHALSMMAGPSLMAAVTTGLTGMFMLFSIVLPYIQIGVFLIVVSAVSWIYSTFFLMSLLYMKGPQNNYGQFSYPSLQQIINSSKLRLNSIFCSLCSRFKSDKMYSLHEMETLNQLDRVPGTVGSASATESNAPVRSKNFTEREKNAAVTGKQKILHNSDNQVPSGSSSDILIQDDYEQCNMNTYVIA